MENVIAVQLAKHIDEQLSLNISSCFDENGGLLSRAVNGSDFEYNIACTLLIYEPDEHKEYLDNLSNMIHGDIAGLNSVLQSIESFNLPNEPVYENVPCSYCGNTTTDLHPNGQCGDCGPGDPESNNENGLVLHVNKPLVLDLLRLVRWNVIDKIRNISVYDAEQDEYYPVENISRTATDDVLDAGHLVLVIKIPQSD